MFLSQYNIQLAPDQGVTSATKGGRARLIGRRVSTTRGRHRCPAVVGGYGRGQGCGRWNGEQSINQKTAHHKSAPRRLQPPESYLYPPKPSKFPITSPNQSHAQTTTIQSSNPKTHHSFHCSKKKKTALHYNNSGQQ